MTHCSQGDNDSNKWKVLIRLVKARNQWKTNFKFWRTLIFVITCSVQFSHSVVSDSLQPHELQHARPSCLSPTPGVHSNSCPSSLWCHPVISSSVIPFSSCPQSLAASESFPMSQLFAWGGQVTGVSALASFLPNLDIIKLHERDKSWLANELMFCLPLWGYLNVQFLTVGQDKDHKSMMCCLRSKHSLVISFVTAGLVLA